MARIFITGSAQGLGRAAAETLLGEGHRLVVHARDSGRAATLADLVRRGADVVIGDLADPQQARSVAEQVNELGRMDAVIHNAGVYGEGHRNPTKAGHPRTLAVNTLAPYLLTVLIRNPGRLIYLTSDMHLGGSGQLDDMDWDARKWDGTQAYCDSKLFVTALALAVGRLRPGTLTHAVDPGWVPTRMGGASAPDDLVEGHLTQSWLAVSDSPEAGSSGSVWHHRRPAPIAAAARDVGFQDQLLEVLARMTGVRLLT
ncbi:SDR family NAD(P)-dependent oxidoreductase [Arthrobacter sp. G.S.26]|uniref:SDR family NAD(P)-dependent oxidoreductase n=1 Tax=Arthrobacter sp. G.S.26 TaxID=3433706 RepID=UPI003D77F62D